MKGKLFRRQQLIPGAYTGLNHAILSTYCIYFPGDTFATSLLEIKPMDVILDVDGYEPPFKESPECRLVTHYSDGSVSWLEVTEDAVLIIIR